MTPDAKLRMDVYQEGQRAFSSGAICPYTDWRAKTWEKGRAASKEWYALNEQSESLEANIKQEQGAPVAKAWAEGYRMGIADERTSEANIGIAGFNAKVEPDRQNPYKTPQPQQEQGESVKVWQEIECPNCGDMARMHTPQQRKPLTDKQIDAIRNQCPPSAGIDFDVRCKDFARAIEAAHGIKE